MPEPDLPVDVARWLATSGVDAVVAATAALDAGDAELTIASRLRGGLAVEHAAAVLGAAQARRRARVLGHPHADALLFTRTALEQASHPAVAAHRAARFDGATTVVDLCCGAGIDTLALAATGARLAAIDLDASRLHLLRHNAAVSDATVMTAVGDALRPPVAMTGVVHADPSRRHDGRRARRLADYGPPVAALLDATRGAAGRGIVVSPAVAWDDPGLPAAAEVEFVQVGRDLVEAVLWLGELRTPGARATATVLPDGGSVTTDGTGEPLEVGPVGGWLVEVVPAAVRARIHDRLGAEIGARRIARTRALLTVDRPPPASAWWTRWEVEAVLPLRERDVRAWLRGADPVPVEIATHGIDVDPERWWRAVGRPARGPGARRLHLVRMDGGSRCLVARRVPDTAARTRGPGPTQGVP